MFALEQSTHYDPSRPAILDGRPQSMQFLRQSSPIRTSDVIRKENVAPANTTYHAQITVKDQGEEHHTTVDTVAPLSPSRLNTSPTKSSLSKKTGSAFRRSGFNPESGIWEDDEELEHKQLPAGRSLHRHQKSVTFDQAPPEINEYEMATPAPSSIASGSREGSYDTADDDEDDEEEEASFERGSSTDHDDSFDASLEDTEKTPVVLPEDWRFMSPDTANTDLSRHEEDVFEEDFGSPAPTAQPGTVSNRPHQISAGSIDSNGQSRPLPPLPPTGAQTNSRSDSLTGAFERVTVASRSLPSPPVAASATNADIQKMGTSSSLTAEDRLRLMALQEQERERRMRRIPAKDPSSVRSSSDEDSIIDSVDLPPVPPMLSESRNTTPSLSRDSILAGLRGQFGRDSRDSSEDIAEMSHQQDLASLDPDVAIPSMEDPTQPQIKEEEAYENDLYSIPDMYSHRTVSDSDASANNDDDLTSQYSQPSLASFAPATMDDEQDTPKAQSPVRDSSFKPETSERVSLPDFADFGKMSTFDIGLASYLSNKEEKGKPLATSTPATDLPDLAALRQSIQRSFTPDIETKQQFAEPPPFSPEQAMPGTPDSVVRHTASVAQPPNDPKSYEKKLPAEPQYESHRSVSPSEPSDTGSVLVNEREASPVSPISAEFDKETVPAIPEPVEEVTADVKPLEAGRKEPEKKRVSSLVPLDIPYASLDEGLGLGLEKEFDRVVETQKVELELSLQRLYYPFNGRFPSSEHPKVEGRKDANPMENVPFLLKPRGARPLPEHNFAVSPDMFGQESFANRARARQRGYLMRQNTKIVVASERMSHDEPRSPGLPTMTEGGFLAPPMEVNQVVSSPRKTSQPTWTAEPWNGKARRKSIRVNGGMAVSKRKPVEGPVPPLPGQISNAQEGLDAVAEDDMGEEEEWEEGAERGRLFVKVVGVKDLQMPFPQREYILPGSRNLRLIKVQTNAPISP